MKPFFKGGVCVKSLEGLEMSPLKMWGRGIGLIVGSHIEEVKINFDPKKGNLGSKNSSVLMGKDCGTRGRWGGGDN